MQGYKIKRIYLFNAILVGVMISSITCGLDNPNYNLDYELNEEYYNYLDDYADFIFEEDEDLSEFEEGVLTLEINDSTTMEDIHEQIEEYKSKVEYIKEKEKVKEDGLILNKHRLIRGEDNSFRYNKGDSEVLRRLFAKYILHNAFRESELSYSEEVNV